MLQIYETLSLRSPTFPFEGKRGAEGKTQRNTNERITKMNIKNFSDRMLIKQKNPFDLVPDAVPYKYFDSIFHTLLDELEEYGITHTVFWHEHRGELPTITKAVMAQLLILLATERVRKTFKEIGQKNEWEETPFEVRENLIWGEIKELLYGK